ncbi:MAG: methyltransferase domain-containing protein [Chloroflexi bacterium]|nr:methyltransferase domain-containing protein [Chloroflexota bacterium]
MSELVQNCPLCGGEHSHLFDQRNFKGHKVVNRICLSCGLVFQSPRMTEKEAAAFYENEYRLLYQGGEDPTAKDLAVQRARAASLLTYVKPHVQELSRHLDIGSSAGLLLQEIGKAYGCQPVGVEPGEAYRKYASHKGMTVYESLETLKRNESTGFDLISMAHVLEHLPDPVGYLSHLRESLLESDGWLLIEAPNLYAHDCFEPAHLFSFSAHTLRQVISRAGYKIVKLEQHGRPRSSILPYYLTALARPAKNPTQHEVKREGKVKFKRQLGMLRRRLLGRLAPGKVWKAV